MDLFNHITQALGWGRPKNPKLPFVVLFKKFKAILERNNRILELMADMGDKLGGEYVFDRQYIQTTCEEMSDLVFKLISDLSVLNHGHNVELFAAFERIRQDIQEELAGRPRLPETGSILEMTGIHTDLIEAVGRKNATLAEVRHFLGLPTPDGFAVTTQAFAAFMAHNRLPTFIQSVAARLDQEGDQGIEEAAREVRQRIMRADLPRSLQKDLTEAVERLKARHEGPLTLAVRSSAWGEDEEHGFAGQFTTLINVAPARVGEAFKTVVAGIYQPAAWAYRRQKGYLEHEAVMAVGCQAMIPSRVSGVLQTLAPWSMEPEAIFISAAWGFCGPVVAGEIPADSYWLSRERPFAVRAQTLVGKNRQTVAMPGGGTTWSDVPPELVSAPTLTPDQLAQLAEAGVSLEKYYKRPQEVEWTFDQNHRLFILQTRALNLRQDPPSNLCPWSPPSDQTRVIMAGRGTVVQRGVASGRVFVVAGDEDLAHFPQGAILVAKHTSPRFSRVMRQATGILTDIGSPAGHMAAIAREFRVPTVVDCGLATALLHTGDEITLDAGQNTVYRGLMPELCQFELRTEDVFEESYEYRLLRRLLKKISPLHLIDPHGPDFHPTSCRTYHDITRYIHEVAVQELILLSEKRRETLEGTPKRLESDLPLGLFVIDLDGTGAADQAKPTLNLAEIRSRPLKALWDGLSESGMWTTEPVAVDMGSMMSSITRTFSAALAEPRTIGRNLAVISTEYLNLNLRIGYHYNIIDAFIGDRYNDNYIYFRFMGGVTDIIRRSRRARFIGAVLEKFDFRVEIHGDLVVGRLKKLSPERMMAKMKLLGGLIGYTRQLDVQMNGDEQMTHYYADFVERINKVMEVHGEPRQSRIG